MTIREQHAFPASDDTSGQLGLTKLEHTVIEFYKARLYWYGGSVAPAVMADEALEHAESLFNRLDNRQGSPAIPETIDAERNRCLAIVRKGVMSSAVRTPLIEAIESGEPA